jgi:hypothetical protein
MGQSTFEDILNEFLNKYETLTDCYYDRPDLTAKITNLINSMKKTPKNRCVICDTDMGICNPRQLCGKTYCYRE